jgi:dGTPase
VPQAEGYEGNAQSFRIITRLDVRRPDSGFGLDLSRATLNATLKYPRLWHPGLHKYGAYADDRAAFEFARAGRNPAGPGARSIEAQIMDWADDITYSVHDTEDFYRAGLIPLDRLADNPAERDYFLERAIERRQSIGKPFSEDRNFRALFREFCNSITLRAPFTGQRGEREQLYEFTSRTINELVQGTHLLPPDRGPEGLTFANAAFATRIALLKELTWCYVINNPASAALQHGQRQAIRTLFAVFDEAAETKNWPLFPPFFRDDAEDLARTSDGPIPVPNRVRLVADTIASMTDTQAMRMYQRLSGLSQGSVLDPILS